MTFIRYTGLANFDGQLGKLLVNVAMKEMSDEDFFVSEITNLSHTSEIGATGYLVMTKNRGGNKASNKWMHEKYIIGEISRADLLHATEETSAYSTAFYFDGECQILTAGMDAEVLALYKSKGINGVKGYPSGTSKHQFWDDATVFMDINAGVKKGSGKRNRCYK